ncbi:MAG: GNAT family N-acetyltransferase [Halanaerobiales bacterium]|nr:GNAT family N-acetyltransferase [Halanaerobiales bacterium]
MITNICESDNMDLIKSVYKNELEWHKLLKANVLSLMNDKLVMISNQHIKTSDFNLIDLWLKEFEIKNKLINYEKEVKRVIKIFKELKIDRFTFRVPLYDSNNMSSLFKFYKDQSELIEDGEDVQLICNFPIYDDQYAIVDQFRTVLVTTEEKNQLWDKLDGSGINMMSRLSQITNRYIFYHLEDPIGCFETIETKLFEKILCGIYSIKILSDYRGKGLGSKMLIEFMKNQKGKAFYLQTWDTNPALKFYKRLGFKEIYRYKRFVKENCL